MKEKQAAAATATTTSTDTRATEPAAHSKRAPTLPLVESLALHAKKNLSAKELTFVNYYKAAVDHVITPKSLRKVFQVKIS